MLPRTERKDAAKHRELILQTASRLFDANGVENVSMHQIAKTAGIGQGTLYRRFAGKADLCSELLMDSFEQFTENTNQYLAQAAQSTVRERLNTFLSNWIDYIANNIQWLNIIKTSSICAGDKNKMYLSPAFTYVTGIIEGLLNEAMEQELLLPVKTDFAAFIIASSISPEAYLFLNEDQHMSSDQIKEHFKSFYLDLMFRSSHLQ